jgi:hypothetical protein
MVDRASEEFMQLFFMQTRDRIVDDCWRLKSDVDSFNENRRPRREVQMVFDFRNDMIEREASRLGSGSPSPEDTVH